MTVLSLSSLFGCSFLANRARGYPEPVVTWRREDGNEIVLKDSSGAKQLGELGGWASDGDRCRRIVQQDVVIHHPIIGTAALSTRICTQPHPVLLLQWLRSAGKCWSWRKSPEEKWAPICALPATLFLRPSRRGFPCRSTVSCNMNVGNCFALINVDILKGNIIRYRICQAFSPIIWRSNIIYLILKYKLVIVV